MAGGRRASDTAVNGRKRKATGKTKGRAKNFYPGECVGVLTAAVTHWAAYRARRTGDMKRRAGGALLQAFVDATPAADQPMARTRTVAAVDKKIKNLRTRFIATCAVIKGTGMSAAHKEDQIIKFGGAMLFDLAREAFKKSHVSTQQTVHEPMDMCADAAASPGSPAAGRAPGGPPAGGSTGGDSSVAEGMDGDEGQDNAAADDREGSKSDGGSAAESIGGESDGGAGTGSEEASSSFSSGSPASKAPSHTATAAEIEASSPKPKKTKKPTAAAVLREYLQQKLVTEGASGAGNGGASGAAGRGSEADDVTDTDVRRAMVNMLNAYAEKARRAQ